MTHVRMFYQSKIGAPEESKWTTIHEVYDQPRVDYIKYRIYRAWWYASWKIKPISWVIDNVADRMLKYAHERTCSNDCVVATRVSDDSSFSTCGRMPLDARMDCKLYDLSIKNVVVIGRTETPRMPS